MFRRLINYSLHAVEILLLVAVLWRLRQLERKEEAIMSQEEDLLQKINDLDAAEKIEEEHLDLIIAALKERHDSPVVAQAIEQLEAIRARVAGFHADDNPGGGGTVSQQ